MREREIGTRDEREREIGAMGYGRKPNGKQEREWEARVSVCV